MITEKKISFIFLVMLVFELKISFLLIYMVYRNDSIWRLGAYLLLVGNRRVPFLKQGEEPSKRLVSLGKSRRRVLHLFSAK